MRNALIIVAIVAMLVALDAVGNDLQFTTSLIAELREFGRLVNRFVAELFG